MLENRIVDRALMLHAWNDEVAVAFGTFMVTGSVVPAGHELGRLAPGAKAMFRRPGLE